MQPAGNVELGEAVHAAASLHLLRYNMSGWAAVTAKDSAAGSWVVADSTGTETGSGVGMESLIASLDEKSIQFAAINVHGNDKKENVTSCRPKIVRINWVGSSVPAMKKMGALTGKQTMAELWNASIEMDLSVAKDFKLVCEDIKSELLRCGGAHKPNEYDFGDHQIAFHFNTEGQ
jgi:hypothetical protein